MKRVLAFISISVKAFSLLVHMMSSYTSEYRDINGSSSRSWFFPPEPKAKMIKTSLTLFRKHNIWGDLEKDFTSVESILNTIICSGY